MVGDKIKQHFVPQCYLNGFADANHRLHVFDKFDRRSYTANVKDIAQQRRFYDFPQDDAKDLAAHSDGEVIFALKFKAETPDPQSVENAFAKLEGDYATALREMEQTIITRKTLSKEQKYIFSHFIAVQWRRTPEHRRTLMEFYEKVSNQAWAMTHPEQKIRFKYDERYASIAQAEDMFSPLINDEIIKILMSHIWVIGLTTDESLLYTSDQPVVKMSRMGLNGFGSPGIQIALPLTPRSALLLCERKTFSFLTGIGYDDNYLDLDAEDVKHYNSLQVRDSYQHIYSQNGDFLFAVEYCTEHPGVCKPKQSRVHVF